MNIDQLHGDDIAGEGRGAETSGWSGLPPELFHRVGQLQEDCRDLVGMERTCKAWRNLVLEGDSRAGVVSDEPCLWRDLALAEDPSIGSVAAVLMDTEQDGPTNFSWKGMLRSHQRASKASEEPSLPPYQPRTKLSDYIFTVEFHVRDDDNDKTVLFTTSGRGLRTPQLWDQEVDEALEVLDRGVLDPELEKRLGDDPFSQLHEMRARVTVTRCSDMSMVELLSSLPVEEDEPVDEADRLIYFQDRWRERGIPRGCLVADRSDVVDRSEYRGMSCVMVVDYKMELRLYLETQTGGVGLEFLCVESGGSGREKNVDCVDVLKYLEMQCPWPADNRDG